MSIDYARLALPGLSGYDFSGIVDAMVQNYSLPLNRMQEKQSTLETVKMLGGISIPDFLLWRKPWTS